MPKLCHKILEENVGKVMEVAACNVCVLLTPDIEWNINPGNDLRVGVEIIMIFGSSAKSH